MEFRYLSYQSNFLKTIEDIKCLLIIVAMPSEEEALLKDQKFETIELGDKIKRVIKRFEVNSCEVLVAQSGVGLVKAGVLLSKIVENYSLDSIIQLGVGGALDPELDVGDVVVSKKVIQHDSVATNDGEDLFIAPGELTLSAPPDQQVDPVMRTDDVLRSWVKDALEQGKQGKVFEGTILSGSEFSARIERKKELRKLDDEAMLVEMEAAAIAQLARSLKIPFVSAKTVADRATPRSSISDDYKTFLNAANSHSRDVLDALLKTFSK